MPLTTLEENLSPIPRHTQIFNAPLFPPPDHIKFQSLCKFATGYIKLCLLYMPGKITALVILHLVKIITNFMLFTLHTMPCHKKKKKALPKHEVMLHKKPSFRMIFFTQVNDCLMRDFTRCYAI